MMVIYIGLIVCQITRFKIFCFSDYYIYKINIKTMKNNTIITILVLVAISFIVYVTIIPITIYKAAHKEQVKEITYELVEPGSELEQFILHND